MYRSIVAAAALAALLTVATPAHAAVPAAAATTATAVTRASVPSGNSDWVPAPQDSLSFPAGVICDFAMRDVPQLDEVMKLVIQTYPDGSSKLEAYKGAFIDRVINTDTGAYEDVDAGGSALVSYHTDGSMSWFVVGPFEVGFRDGHGNLPRGWYQVTGLSRLDISPTGFLTLTQVFGSTINICTHLA
jgi:hypothetical protein